MAVLVIWAAVIDPFGHLQIIVNSSVVKMHGAVKNQVWQPGMKRAGMQMMSMGDGRSMYIYIYIPLCRECWGQ